MRLSTLVLLSALVGVLAGISCSFDSVRADVSGCADEDTVSGLNQAGGAEEGQAAASAAAYSTNCQSGVPEAEGQITGTRRRRLLQFPLEPEVRLPRTPFTASSEERSLLQERSLLACGCTGGTDCDCNNCESEPSNPCATAVNSANYGSGWCGNNICDSTVGRVCTAANYYPCPD